MCANGAPNSGKSCRTDLETNTFRQNWTFVNPQTAEEDVDEYQALPFCKRLPLKSGPVRGIAVVRHIVLVPSTSQLCDVHSADRERLLRRGTRSEVRGCPILEMQNAATRSREPPAGNEDRRQIGVQRNETGPAFAVTKTQRFPLNGQGRRHQMRRLRSAVHRLGQILTEIVEARLPMSVWLDFTTLHLYKARP